jgi:long-subunit fatty acid transport protein
MTGRITFAALLLLCAAAVPAHAQGFILPGIGPINNAMGAAGVALPEDSQAALNTNPALIGKVEGNQITFSTEFFKDGAHFDASVGGFSGGTDGTHALAVIPSFGWMGHITDGSKVVLGFGLLGVAGFRTDFPQDSANPLLSPQPYGYGRFYTDLQIAKIPFAMAAQVNPKLTVGMSLNLYRGVLAVSPLPGSQPDVAANGAIFLESGANQVPKFGFGAQFGAIYDVNPMVSLGLSYTTPQKYQQYQWNSTNADVTSPDFGKATILKFNLDGPQIVTFGTALKPKKNIRLAFDARHVKMGSVRGIGESGADSLIQWRSVWSVLMGGEFWVNERSAVRVGFNYLQTPIREERVSVSLGTPSTFQKHFTFGAGTMVSPHMGFDLGFYIVPRESLTGPVLNPLTDEPIPGSSVTLSSKLTSFQFGLNFKF